MKSIFKTLAIVLFAGVLFTACGDDKEYTITVNANDDSMGSTIGSGTYSEGTTLQIMAVPNSGYEFRGWTDGNTDNPRTITVTGDATYTAEFAEEGSVPGGNVTMTVTFDGETWEGVGVFRQFVSSPDNSQTYQILQVMHDQDGSGPIACLMIKGDVGTYVDSDFEYNAGMYLDNANDYVTVNGQQYPHYMSMGDYTATVTAYDLATGTITMTAEADLLNMEGEANGSPREFKHLSVVLEDVLLSNLNKSATVKANKK